MKEGWKVIKGKKEKKIILRNKRKGKKEEKEEKKRRECEEIRMQAMWRRRKGGIELHLKRQEMEMQEREARDA